jgi:RNA polymerase sigma-70 factor (ECF subfamily)
MQKPWETDLHIYDDEAQLLAGLRQGDRLACSCLLKRYAPRFLRLARQLTGDPEEAEEVLQEAFTAACAQMPRFEGRSGLGTWLHRIVVNTALMRLRRRTAREQPLTEEMPLPAVEQLSSPEAIALNAETRTAIDTAVLALPAALRAAFVLYELDGMPVREAAHALGISESALKVRAHRARQALRVALADVVSAPEPPPLSSEMEQRLTDHLCAFHPSSAPSPA